MANVSRPYSAAPSQRERDLITWTAWLDGQWVEVHRTRKELNREIVGNLLLRSACVDCGEWDPRVLQFDHRDPSLKEFNIPRAVPTVHPRELMLELDKCDVRCANCHMRRTSRQFNWWREDLMTWPQLERAGSKVRLRVAVSWSPLGTQYRSCILANGAKAMAMKRRAHVAPGY